MNSYELSRNWFDWSFENPEKINPNHAAIYFFAIEHCNRLGWREKFGFPTQMAMDALGIKKHQTYIKYFNDLVDWGFFKLIEKSKNQYSSNIICLTSAMPKNGKALDKAITNHAAKQTETTRQSTGQSNGSIIKQYNNKPINQLNNKTINENLQFSNASDFEISEFELNKNSIKTEKEKKENPGGQKFDFETALIDYGFDEGLVRDWLIVRKKAKAVNTETAFRRFIREIEIGTENKNDLLEFIISKNWRGFEYQWFEKAKKEFNNNQNILQNGQQQKQTVTDKLAAAYHANRTGWDFQPNNAGLGNNNETN